MICIALAESISIHIYLTKIKSTIACFDNILFKIVVQKEPEEVSWNIQKFGYLCRINRGKI